MKIKFKKGDIMKVVKIVSVFLVLIAVFLIFHHTTASSITISKESATDLRYFHTLHSIGPYGAQPTTFMPAPSQSTGDNSYAIEATSHNSSQELYITFPDGQQQPLETNVPLTASGYSYEPGFGEIYISKVKNEQGRQLTKDLANKYEITVNTYQKN